MNNFKKFINKNYRILFILVAVLVIGMPLALSSHSSSLNCSTCVHKHEVFHVAAYKKTGSYWKKIHDGHGANLTDSDVIAVYSRYKVDAIAKGLRKEIGDNRKALRDEINKNEIELLKDEIKKLKKEINNIKDQ